MIVGLGRVHLVRELLDVWETAGVEQRMRLVVLQGPTGIGKTAVLQGLYKQVAMRQPRPAYWPPRIDSQPTATVTDDDRTGEVVGRAARQGWCFPNGSPPRQAWNGGWWWRVTATSSSTSSRVRSRRCSGGG